MAAAAQWATAAQGGSARGSGKSPKAPARALKQRGRGPAFEAIWETAQTLELALACQPLHLAGLICEIDLSLGEVSGSSLPLFVCSLKTTSLLNPRS